MSDAIQRLPYQHSSGQASPVEVTLLSNLRIRDLDHVPNDPQRLTFHLLQFVLEGEGAHWIDFERVPLRSGDVLHIRPEQVHSFDADASHEALMILFTPEVSQLALVPSRWNATPAFHPATTDFEFLTDVLRLIQRLDAEPGALRPESIGPRLLGAVLAGLTDAVAAQHGPIDPIAQRYEALVQDFEVHLDAHHTTSRSPSWYAAALGTTSRTLARACRQSRGRSPKQIVDARVVLEAKRRLATTDDTVESVSYALGFSEPTNFVKYFRRIGGTTPEAFRRSQPGVA
ncbi:MAG: helix-turn-helix transcriptional regulator [Bacteroidota bacterium]